MRDTKKIEVEGTLYTLIVANVPYYIYEYVTDQYIDYVIRTIDGRILEKSSIEYQRVGKAFVDSTPD